MSIEILSQSEVHKFALHQVAVGRADGNDLLVSHPEVSGKHLILRMLKGTVIVEDLGSTNGTYVGNIRISGPTPVAHGIDIQLGATGPIIQAWAGAPIDDPDATLLPQKKRPAVGGDPAVFHPVAPQPSAPAKSFAPIWIALLILSGLAGLAYTQVMGKLEGIDSQATAAENTVDAAMVEFKRQLEPVMTAALGPAEAKTVLGAMETADHVLRRMRVTAADPNLSEVERDEQMARLRRELRAPQEAVDAVNAKLSQRAGYSWDDILKESTESIFLIAVYYLNRDGEVFGRGTGTAWALDSKGWLGTNAHVAEMIDPSDWPEGTKRVVKIAIQGGTGKVFEIEKIKVHSDWNGDVNSPDVGLIRVDAPQGTFKPLRVATKARYEALAAGTALGTTGFPGELTDEFVDGLEQAVLDGKNTGDLSAPGATPIFKACFITRVTDFERRPAPPGKSQFIGHSASTTSGTSGSPMFDKDGFVVALNNSSLQLNLGEDRRINSPAALNNGIRVDLLLDLYREISLR